LCDRCGHGRVLLC
nr:immunoglobulin heavy chain junction region [Homo sapiens]